MNFPLISRERIDSFIHQLFPHVRYLLHTVDQSLQHPTESIRLQQSSLLLTLVFPCLGQNSIVTYYLMILAALLLAATARSRRSPLQQSFDHLKVHFLPHLDARQSQK